jgi:hypothetical protein
MTERGYWWKHTTEEMQRQQAARDAIMQQIPSERSLMHAIRRGLGYGPHDEFMQQLCYWFGPRKPKMQTRWTLYKTYAQWEDELAYSPRQVKAARNVLGKKKLIGWKRGQYGRVHYRVNWVGLAEVLGLEFNQNGNGGPIDDLNDDVFDLDGGFNRNGNGGPIQSERYSVQFNRNGITVQSNTEDYAGDYSSEQSSLQVGGEPAYAEPPPPHMNGKREEKQSHGVTVLDKRYSQNGHTPSEKKAAKEVVTEPPPPAKPDNDTLLAEVKDVLDPESGKWWGAQFVEKHREAYKVEKVVEFLSRDPELPYNGRAEELEPYVRYVLWEAEG